MRLLRKVGKKTEVWEIEAKAKSITTKTGQQHSVLKEKKQTFPTPAKTKEAYDKLVATKRDAGYREPFEIDKPQVPIARNAELEAAIREDRTDPGPYLVYADWLQAKGSPFGEAIVLANAKKQKQAMAIATQIGLPPEDLATYGWRTGFWQWLRFDNAVDWMDNKFEPLTIVKPLFESPLCAALEELRIGVFRWDYNDTDVPATIKEAGKHAWAKDLQRLHLGDVSGDIDMDHHVIGDVGKLISKHFPNLVWLKLHSGSQSWNGGKETFGIGGFELPKLKELIIETCAMSRKRMKGFTAAKLPQLERLELWFGAKDREGTAKIADVMPVFDGKLFPKLRHLGLRNTELDVDIARMLPASTIAKQLESLDLSMGTLNDSEAGELAEGAAKFPKLKTLCVDDTYVTATGAKVLKVAFKGVKISAKDPKEPYDFAPEDRYVSVSE